MFLSAVVTLLTTVPLWVVVALGFCLKKIVRKYKAPSTVRHPYFCYAATLPLTLLFALSLPSFWAAIRYSGPISGTVIDMHTLKPVAGAHVTVVCGLNFGNNPYPWHFGYFVRLLNAKGHMQHAKTDAEGHFHLGWFGYDTLNAVCNVDYMFATATGYRLYESRSHKTRIEHPAALFSTPLVKMDSTTSFENQPRPAP